MPVPQHIYSDNHVLAAITVLLRDFEESVASAYDAAPDAVTGRVSPTRPKADSALLNKTSQTLTEIITQAGIASLRLDPEALLNEEEAGVLIGFTPRTLQAWRRRGNGPKFIRISSRAVRYRRKDLAMWAEAKQKASTSDA